jgi:hypothetical protein
MAELNSALVDLKGVPDLKSHLDMTLPPKSGVLEPC